MFFVDSAIRVIGIASLPIILVVEVENSAWLYFVFAIENWKHFREEQALIKRLYVQKTTRTRKEYQ